MSSGEIVTNVTYVTYVTDCNNNPTAHLGVDTAGQKKHNKYIGSGDIQMSHKLVADAIRHAYLESLYAEMESRQQTRIMYVRDAMFVWYEETWLEI